MVIAQLSRLGGEAEVCDAGDTNGAGLFVVDAETAGPRAVGLVEEVEGEVFVLEVGEAAFHGG